MKAKYSLYIALAAALAASSAVADNMSVKVRYGRGGKILSIENRAVNKHSSHPGTSKLAQLNKSQSAISNRAIAANAAMGVSDPIVTSDAFLSGLASGGMAFGATDIRKELFPQGVSYDNIGMKHVRYQQEINGVPVYGAELITHLNSAGGVVSANGRLLENKNISTRPAISSDKAEKIAQSLLESTAEHRALVKFAKKTSKKNCRRAKGKKQKNKCSKKVSRALLEAKGPYSGQAPKLFVYNEGFIANRGESETHLVWEVKIKTGPDHGQYVYVDAQSGKIVKTRDIRHHLNRRIRDCSDPLGNDTCLADTLVSFWGYFFGRSEGQPVRGPNPLPAPFLGSTDVDDAYDLMPSIHQYYVDRFARNGGNNLGGLGNGVQSPFDETQVLVHTNGNSFFDSICGSGGASAGEYRVEFCLGTLRYDVLGHEYAHLVARYRGSTDGTQNVLVYSGESGALNESNSDIFGEAFERYMTGNTDWIAGSGLSGGVGHRKLFDPPLSNFTVLGLPQPDNYFDENIYCGSDDNGGVHTNSTIPSKAAYLTAEGGSFNGCDISGIGFDKVEQIWYRALINYYTSTETFNGAYTGLLSACQDLFTPQDCEEVAKALQAVEMDQPGGCGSSATPIPPACAFSCSLNGAFAEI